MKRHALLLTAVLTIALVVAAGAQTWTEQGEAGDLPATAQVVLGSGPLTEISGTINQPGHPNGVGNDRDMYQIKIVDPANFSASTVGGSTLDTQLFLFDINGNGVTMNDDEVGGTSLQSRLTSQFVSAPGLYYLAISRYDRDPTRSGQEIWLDLPFRSERQPDGPGAPGPVDGWTGFATSSVTGAYRISLTGVEFVPEPASMIVLATGLAGLALRRRKK